jgi:peptidoglycan/LPS O-acetylase OafA/YrhL
MLLVALLCVGCLQLRLGEAMLHPELLNTQTFYVLSQYRLDSIGFGALRALACQTADGRTVLLRLAQPMFVTVAITVILGCLLIRDPWFRETWRYSLEGISIVIIVSAILFGERYHLVHWFLNTVVLRWIGRVSYSLYVWHEGISFFLPIESLPHWQQPVVCLFASFAVATISYYVVEQPFLMLRSRFRIGGNPP